jgi:ubiquinone/menaquinone biosynthesis C-methylase UbiE
VVKAFAQQRVRFISSIFRSARLETALDVGCGDGFGMYYMQPLVEAIHGCDRSDTMLRANPADDNLLQQCDACDLPYDEGQFDLVYCWELLHHVENPQLVVREMARVTNKAVLICEPNCLNPAMALFGLMKREERGLLRFTPSFPANLMRSAGLRQIRRFTVGWFPPNRTPELLAKALVKAPFRIPILGMYTITVALKDNGSDAATPTRLSKLR